MARFDYVKFPNQGNIVTNLRLLYEMSISSGYADEHGYFTKRDVAEIAASALLITTKSRIGEDVIDTLDEGESEEMNSALQNAKMRMQILRLLGLISTDYDSEIYAITDLAELISPQKPNKKVLLELFMGVCSSSEVYEHNCDLNFNCYPGYQICYALASLDYKLSTAEMPVLMTYDIREIKDFVRDAQAFRAEGKPFDKAHPHYPRTQSGKVLGQPSNITRTSNQILRYCEILEKRSVRFGRENYYVCTDYGKKYVDRIKRFIDGKNSCFLSAPEFRKLNIFKQKETCQEGISNFMIKSGLDNESVLTDLVFLPQQMITETNMNWLLDRSVRLHPTSKNSQINAINSEITKRDLRLTALYEAIHLNNKAGDGRSETEQAIRRALEERKTTEQIVAEFYDLHKDDNKFTFYPFVHQLLNIVGLECKGEIGRFDAYCLYKGHVIPVEIKSKTETPSYNAKGIRQGLENKICSFNPSLAGDLAFSSLVIGYDHPTNDADIKNLIDNAHEQYSINIIACNIESLLVMAVKVIGEGLRINWERLLISYGIIYEC